MSYSKQTWADSPATSSPINAAALNHIENGLFAAAAVADAAVPSALVGQASGVAALDGAGKVPSAQLPSAAVSSVDGLTGAVSLTGRYVGRQPWQFRVEDYGALGDGTTNDTAAINSAIAAAVAYAQANTGFAEVLFRAVTYLVNGPLTQGTQKGNALLALPVVAATGQKVTLALRGPGVAGSFGHWSQTVPQRSGAVLRTTLTGQTNDPTYGAPSIIGGPTPQQGYGSATNVWSNMLVVIDGLTVVAPLNPSLMGFDLRGVAQAQIVSASAMADATPSQMGAQYSSLSSSWATGLYMPGNNNNDLSLIGSFACEGFYYGIGLGEHTVANRVAAIYCNRGLYVPVSTHGVLVNYASVESCTVGVESDGDYQLQMLDTEAVTTHLLDRGGHGQVGIRDTASLVVSGGAGLKVLDLHRAVGGTYTSTDIPAVPASGTVFTNPYFRDCVLTITGGTLSAIKVGGITLGVTSGTVVLPSNKTIEIDYTAAPSWTWTLL